MNVFQFCDVLHKCLEKTVTDVPHTLLHVSLSYHGECFLFSFHIYLNHYFSRLRFDKNWIKKKLTKNNGYTDRVDLIHA